MRFFGAIVKITDPADTKAGRLGVIVGLYSRGEKLYSTDYGVIFPERYNVQYTNKYQKYSYKEEQVSSLHPTDTQLKDYMKCKVMQKMLTQKDGMAIDELISDDTIKPTKEIKMHKFFQIEPAGDNNLKGHAYKNRYDTLALAEQGCKDLIIAHPTASFYILEAVTVVKPKSEVDIITLRAQPELGPSTATTGSTPV